jgi:hypothetical protein
MCMKHVCVFFAGCAASHPSIQTHPAPHLPQLRLGDGLQHANDSAGCGRALSPFALGAASLAGRSCHGSFLPLCSWVQPAPAAVQAAPARAQEHQHVAGPPPHHALLIWWCWCVVGREGQKDRGRERGRERGSARDVQVLRERERDWVRERGREHA